MNALVQLEMSLVFTRMTDGDHEAWNEFIKTHLPAMRRAARQEFIRRRLLRGDSLEVCQSAFRQLLQKMKDDKVVLNDPNSLVGLLIVSFR